MGLIMILDVNSIIWSGVSVYYKCCKLGEIIIILQNFLQNFIQKYEFYIWVYLKGETKSEMENFGGLKVDKFFL